MDFLVLLSVLAITQSVVLARPGDTKLKTKRSATGDSTRIFKPSSIKFPTQLKNEYRVTINGTLDTKSKTFEVVFPSRNRKEKDQCRIKYDFKTRMLDILPEHPAWKPEKYELFSKEEPPTFSIRLQAWTINKTHMFKLFFEVNNGGESSLMTCDLAKFDDFEIIEFKSGLHSIKSFFVGF